MNSRKTIALTRWTLVSKVMPLLFNMLSRLVIAFLPRSKRLNFMAAVTICSNSGAQKHKVSHCFHCFPIYLPWSGGTRCHDLSFLKTKFSYICVCVYIYIYYIYIYTYTHTHTHTYTHIYKMRRVTNPKSVLAKHWFSLIFILFSVTEHKRHFEKIGKTQIILTLSSKIYFGISPLPRLPRNRAWVRAWALRLCWAMPEKQKRNTRQRRTRSKKVWITQRSWLLEEM